MTTNQEENEQAFARGPQSNLFGPLDDSIDFRVSGESKIKWMRHARSLGYGSLGEYIRITIEKDIEGEAHLVSMFTRMLSGNRAHVGQEHGTNDQGTTS